uniref:Uncharacterized protein n=1 Tax=Oryza barthii TaxID=65489 RepID=A0A0D3GAB8_9ORYZ
MSGDQMGSEPPRVATGVVPKTAARIGSFSRLLSGLDAGGVLRDVEPEKMKDEIRRWAKSVVSLVRQLSFGAPPPPENHRSSNSIVHTS